MNRNNALDGIRGLAILLVILSHFLPLRGVGIELINGKVGVILFFVLSGYLIGIQMPKINKPDAHGKQNTIKGLLKFYLRRTLRIYPLYIVLIVAFYLIPINIPGYLRTNFFSFLFMNQNWLMYVNNSFDAFLGPYWSLSLEMKFYLILPFFYIFLSERNFFRFTFLTLFVGIFSRLIMGIMAGNDRIVSFLLINHIDSFAAGVLISRVHLFPEKWRNPASKNWKILLIITALFYSTFFFFNSFYLQTIFKNTLVNIIAGWLILNCITSDYGRVQTIFSNKFLSYCGTRSYSLYLLHNISWWFIELFIVVWNKVTGSHIYDVDYTLFLTLKIVSSFLLAEISYRFIEMPFNNLRHKIT